VRCRLRWGFERVAWRLAISALSQNVRFKAVAYQHVAKLIEAAAERLSIPGA
jgi:hypothetical protein